MRRGRAGPSRALRASALQRPLAAPGPGAGAQRGAPGPGAPGRYGQPRAGTGTPGQRGDPRSGAGRGSPRDARGPGGPEGPGARCRLARQGAAVPGRPCPFLLAAGARSPAPGSPGFPCRGGRSAPGAPLASAPLAGERRGARCPRHPHPAQRWPVAPAPSTLLRPCRGPWGHVAVLGAVAEGTNPVLGAAALEGLKTPRVWSLHRSPPALPPPSSWHLRSQIDSCGRRGHGAGLQQQPAWLTAVPRLETRPSARAVFVFDTRTHMSPGMSLSVLHAALMPAAGTAAGAGGIQPTLLPAAPSAVSCTQGLCVCRQGFGSWGSGSGAGAAVAAACEIRRHSSWGLLESLASPQECTRN